MSKTYPHHHLMKKNRVIKLQQTKGECEICGKSAQVVHHIDDSKDNHSLENLLAVCCKCHRALHHPDEVDAVYKTSKFIRLYGGSIAQIVKRTGLTSNKVYEMHYTHKLGQYLDALVARGKLFASDKQEKKVKTH